MLSATGFALWRSRSASGRAQKHGMKLLRGHFSAAEMHTPATCRAGPRSRISAETRRDRQALSEMRSHRRCDPRAGVGTRLVRAGKRVFASLNTATRFCEFTVMLAASSTSGWLDRFNRIALGWSSIMR
jgi:hypothetical protein